MQDAELLESLALENLKPTEVGNWYERADILVNEMSLNWHRYSVFKDFCELRYNVLLILL